MPHTVNCEVLSWTLSDTLFTGSIALSTKPQYLSCSEANFEVYRSAGVTRYTDGGEIWHPLLHAKFQVSLKISVLAILYPYRCTDGGEMWHGGGDAKFHPPGRPKTLSFCLFVRHAFEGVGVQKQF